MAKDPYMKKVCEQARYLCESFDRDQFESQLRKCKLDNLIPYINHYMETGWIVPIESGNRQRFNRGHLLILIRLSSCTNLSYQPGIIGNYDFEDLMLRRACLSDLEAENVRDDAHHINELFKWIGGDEFNTLDPIHLVHTKAVIDIALDKLDPEGFYETLNSQNGTGVYKLVKDLLTMQTEIGSIVSIASSAGMDTPSIQYIFDRKRILDEMHDMFMPLQSPYLATPIRDMSAQERFAFINKRNRLLIRQDYQGLIEYYKKNIHLFESDAKVHANLCVCIGNIYGELLDDSNKATIAFSEAIGYHPGNEEAFAAISNLLRSDERWAELVELLERAAELIDDPAKKCAMLLECAQIQAFKSQNIIEAIEFYERCMIEGHPGNVFDELYMIVAGLMDDCKEIERLRAIVTLTTHCVNYSQCDKIVALQQKNDNSVEPVNRFMSQLIDAGVQCFKGDPPMALEILRDAIPLAPENPLMDGLLLRIASKISKYEFHEIISERDFTSMLADEKASSVWYRIAKTLTRVPKLKDLALDYAEKAISTHASNQAAIDLCLQLAMDMRKLDRAYVYATVKAARTNDSKLKAELEENCETFKASFENDEDARLGVYISLLQFKESQESSVNYLREAMASADNRQAVELLQRIESMCDVTRLAFVGDLYQSLLERQLDADAQKTVLERYVHFMLGQGTNMDLNAFIPAHAQLYALSPSDKLFTMVKSALQDNATAMSAWTDCLEGIISSIDDKIRVQKAYMALADCYQHVLKQPDKAADAFANLLKAAPDNIPAFKCTFSAFERLERYSECVDVFQTFPMEKLAAQERINFALKCLNIALIHLFDVKAMAKFLGVIIKEDAKLSLDVVEQLLEKANAAQMDKDQLLGCLEQLEATQSGLTAVAICAARIKVLIQLERLDEAAALLNQTTYQNAKACQLDEHIKKIAAIFKEKKADYKAVCSVWFAEAMVMPFKPSAPPVPTETPSADSELDIIVKKCAEKLDDAEYVANLVGDALKTLSPDQATTLCLKLGELYEAKEKYPEAEEYFKKAFGMTQHCELAEFYKRRRKFKNAIKILTFKLSKAADDAQNAIRIDIALTHEKRNDFVSAIQILDEVIEHKNSLDKGTILSVLRQKAAYQLKAGNPADAIATLKQASLEADFKTREEIDVETCLLMREIAPAEAKKLHQSLMLRGAKSEGMIHLNLCMDIDNEKYPEAEKRIDELLKSSNPICKVWAYEQKLRMQIKRGDAAEEIKESAAKLLALVPNHAEAQKHI